MDGLVALLDWLAGHPEEVRAAGKRARAAFEEHYDLPVGVARICEILGADKHEFRPLPDGRGSETPAEPRASASGTCRLKRLGLRVEEHVLARAAGA